MPLVRVRKSQIPESPHIQADGLDICLACWRDYMHTDDKARAEALMQFRIKPEEGGGYDSDPYGEQHRADLRIGEATDAMISSLIRMQIWAIYKAYGIGQVWDFPNADFAQTLEMAKIELEKKLRNNIATATKFC